MALFRLRFPGNYTNTTTRGLAVDDEADGELSEVRLRAILKAAFAGAPTELQDIPTRVGKRRSIARRSPTSEEPLNLASLDAERGAPSALCMQDPHPIELLLRSAVAIQESRRLSADARRLRIALVVHKQKIASFSLF